MGWTPKLTSPLTTKGDIFGYDSDDARVPVGTDDHVLTADSAQSLGVKWAVAAGGGGGSTPSYIVGFGEDNLAASLTDSQLYRNVQGVALQVPVVVSHSGDIIGVTVASSEARTAGTATFEVFKNGTGTGLSVVLDGTDTQYAAAAQATGLDTFASGDRLDVRVTTDGSWAPTTADVEASIVIADGVVGQSVPDWVVYLTERLSGETSHTDDDFFTLDSSGDYTEQTVTGTAVWTIAQGVASVVYDGQSGSDVAAKLKPITTATLPITIETAVSMVATGQDFTHIGVCFTDGTATTSNVALSRLHRTGNDATYRTGAGTLTSFNTDINNSLVNAADHLPFGFIYMRLVWDATNNFKASFGDGVSWTDFDATGVSFAKTMTPTHFGIHVSTQSGTIANIATFQYFRVYDADLSV